MYKLFDIPGIDTWFFDLFAEPRLGIALILRKEVLQIDLFGLGFRISRCF